MSIIEKSNAIVTDLTPGIGSAIKTDPETLLSGTLAGKIRELMESRGVIAFPEINLTDQQQVAFTKTLGTIAHEDGDADGVFKVTMDSRENPIADYLKGAFYWHIDGTMSDVPILGSIMSSRRLAPTGGETEFCNTYAAYEALPEEEKAALEDVQIVHAMAVSQLYWMPEPSHAQWKAWRSRGTKTLPLVWKHRSGRRSLVLGATASHVVGLGPLESTDLLIRLRDWATQPQFVYQHTWKLGDMVVWDNTGTMHRALPYAYDSGRMMHRTKLEGEEAFA
jgi:alpha-ketoglutarate-dependent taurine dioxygenase